MCRRSERRRQRAHSGSSISGSSMTGATSSRGRASPNGSVVGSMAGSNTSCNDAYGAYDPNKRTLIVLCEIYNFKSTNLCRNRRLSPYRVRLSAPTLCTAFLHQLCQNDQPGSIIYLQHPSPLLHHVRRSAAPCPTSSALLWV